jgi:hypothetical protein
MENAPDTETPTAAAATAHRLGSGFGGPEGIPPIPPPPPPPPRTTSTSLGVVPSYETELKLLFYGDPNWAVEPVSDNGSAACTGCFALFYCLQSHMITCNTQRVQAQEGRGASHEPKSTGGWGAGRVLVPWELLLVKCIHGNGDAQQSGPVVLRVVHQALATCLTPALLHPVFCAALHRCGTTLT